MELREAILNRKTIRTFNNEKIDNRVLEELVEYAIYAPSACNMQAWKFIIINDYALRQKIIKKYGSSLIGTAPNGILVIYRQDVTNNSKIYKDHIQSASAAIQNFLLAAYEKGLGACWICNLPSPDYIRKTLKIPQQYDIIAYIAVGYPKEYLSDRTISHYSGNVENAAIRKRKYSINEVISYNEFIEHYDLSKTKKNLFLIRIVQWILCNNSNKKLKVALERFRDFFCVR